MADKTGDTRHADNFGEEQRGGCEGGEERAEERSSHKDDDTSKADAPRIEDATDRARKVLRGATEWYKSNPAAWRYIVRRAMHLAGEGQRIGVQRLVEEVRAHDFADITGGATKTNNSYVAVFARKLVSQWPPLAPYIVLRASALDAVMDGKGECWRVPFDWSDYDGE